jgi:heme/copper-type cytochrome/quinol oxidase subunit 3
VARSRPARAAESSEWATTFSVCRTFWHFLGGVWLFVFALVSVW